MIDFLKRNKLFVILIAVVVTFVIFLATVIIIGKIQNTQEADIQTTTPTPIPTSTPTPTPTPEPSQTAYKKVREDEVKTDWVISDKDYPNIADINGHIYTKTTNKIDNYPAYYYFDRITCTETIVIYYDYVTKNYGNTEQQIFNYIKDTYSKIASWSQYNCDDITIYEHKDALTGADLYHFEVSAINKNGTNQCFAFLQEPVQREIKENEKDYYFKNKLTPMRMTFVIKCCAVPCSDFAPTQEELVADYSYSLESGVHVKLKKPYIQKANRCLLFLQ